MNLKLVWHIFCTDARHLRWLILAVWVAIIIDAWPFLVNSVWKLPLADGHSSSAVAESYARCPGGIGPSWLVPAGWLLAVALGCNGKDAFRLLPIRRLDVVASKLLFLLLVIYIPQWITISLVFMRHDVVFAQAFSSIIAATAIIVPLWMIGVALGRLAGNLWRASGVFITTAICTALLSIAGVKYVSLQVGLFFTVMSDSWGKNPGPMAWVLVSSIAAGLLLLVRLTMVKWQPAKRCLAAVVWTLAMVIACSDVPKVSVCSSPSSLLKLDQNTLDAIQPIITKPLRNWRNERVVNTEFINHSIAVIDSKNLPSDTFCCWSRSYKPFSIHKRRHTNPLDNQFFNPHALLSAIEKKLPNVGVYKLHSNISNDSGILLDLSQSGGISGQSISLQGLLCRMELLADIPFVTDGVRVPVEQGWIHAKRYYRNSADSTPYIDLAMHGGVSGHGSTLSQLSWNVDFSELWQVFFYVPKSGKAYYCGDSNEFVGSGPLLSSGYIHRKIIAIEHPEQFVKFAESDLEGARLLIFSPRILKILERTLVIPPNLEIESKVEYNYDRNEVKGPRVLPKDFFAEAVSRRPDPSKASDEEFGRWMLFCEGNFSMNSWVAREYGEWLPSKLGMLLEGEPDGPYVSARTQALYAACPESKKEEVIAQLSEKPWLLQLVYSRGWLKDAKHEILQLFRSGHGYAGISVYVALLKEPSTYDRLLEILSRNGDTKLYHALSRIPALADPLDQAVKSYYSRVTTHGLPPDGLDSRYNPVSISYLDLPLIHGVPDAMRDALVIFHACKAEKHSYMREELAKYFILPSGIDLSKESSITFFRDLRMENIHWDDLARRWRTNEK